MNYFCWTFFDTVFESYEETISFENCLKNILLYCWLHSLQQNLTILLYNTSFYDQNLLLWLENEFFFKLLSSFFIDCLYAIWKHRNNSTRKEEQQKTCLDIQIYIVALKSILLNKRQNRETFFIFNSRLHRVGKCLPKPSRYTWKRWSRIEGFQEIFNLSRKKPLWKLRKESRKSRPISKLKKILFLTTLLSQHKKSCCGWCYLFMWWHFWDRKRF